ncbi:hypothetical protein [Streptomyces sp. NPDC056061]|uniref:hypothetical protein n=1 Tax=Streptomyces sp. NPDC056061 TaxID=3345700 RepID=UPI0035E3A240
MPPGPGCVAACASATGRHRCAPFYLRLRGSDGKRHGRGFLGAAIDPHGPLPHEPGRGNPWLDTWFHTNPVFVDVVR